MLQRYSLCSVEVWVAQAYEIIPVPKRYRLMNKD